MRADALRRMAQTYRTLADAADAAGQFAVAASHARVVKLMEEQAEGLEALYPQDDPANPPMICDGCGSVGRHDGRNFVWTPPDPRVETLHRATCPECHKARVMAQRRRYHSDARRTVRRQTHKEPWAPGTSPVDPFQGFREGDK